MKLTYKAVSQDGKNVKGIIEAKNASEAASYLRSHGFLPISLKNKDDEKNVSKLFPFLKRSNNADTVFFTRQLASTLASGLTLMQSLSIIKDQVQSPTIKAFISGVIADIEEGKTFSEAITKYPDMFSPIYISLLKSAETSGLLDKVLLRLADNLEKQQKLKSTIKSALLYPSIVITGMIGVVAIMMIFVIPQISVLYQNMNISLPLPTLIVVGASNFTVTFWPMILAAIAGIFVFYKRWQKTEKGRAIIDDLKLKIPIFGKLNKEMILTEFTRTLGLLIGSGSLIVESLRQSSDTAGNVFYKNSIEGVARRVEKGMTIGDAMTAYSLFPPMLIQMVKIGEQTGKLDESLMRVSEYFEREVDQSVKTLTTAMEPIIMVVLGIGVAFLIISIITPIYNLTSAIQ